MPAPNVDRQISATGNGTASSVASVSLSRDHIKEALQKSRDGGATLDLAHKHLTDVGEDGAEELASVGQEAETEGDSTVVRIALSHNRLATLPMAFTLLSRLSYLVLKNNNFTVFPDVLTIMPSLEILDISRNKIKKLPSHPGSLIKLRVFSIARNKIHRIPPYFPQFRNLELFRVDQNPLEWPPRDVMELPAHEDDPLIIKEWIRGFQGWIESNAPVPSERKLSDDSISSDKVSTNSGHDSPLHGTSHDAYTHASQDVFVVGSSRHGRTMSTESDLSVYSDKLNIQPKVASASRSPRSPRPPRLHLDSRPISRDPSNSATSVHSPDSYLPTPAESSSSNDEDSTRSTVNQQQHGRNASYAGGILTSSHSRLASKKSLPDLRPPKLHLSNNRDTVGRYPIPSPPHRQESESSNGSLGIFRTGRILPQNGVVHSPVTLDRPAPSMDVERNSYFRRLSTLTPASLSKTIPPVLLGLVDAVRGILFAVSQIYQSLQHYTVYAIDERLSAVLLKVLDPASTYMTQLINALDRFDSISRRTLPPPAICRSVVESCRDNVTVFGKAVGVLALQLKVLATHDDVRYTRQMLVVLYGAMTEVSCAWQAMAGQIDEVKPFLRDHRAPSIPKSYPPHPPTMRTTLPFAAESTIISPVTPARASPHSVHLSGPRPSTRLDTSDGDGKVRMSRRHAGSFSYKDVEIGKMLPSYDLPQLSANMAGPSSNTPTLRTMRRQPAVNPAGTNGAFYDGTVRPSTSAPRWDAHSRQSSTSSFMPSSSSSPSLGLRTPSFDQMSSTNTLVDKEAIEAMKIAVRAAPSVWETTDEILRDAPQLKEELMDILNRAKATTERLNLNIQAVENGFPIADKKTLRDDAHLFANTVIQLLNAIKAHGSTHPLSSTLRTNMVKLTNATQEYVMLLHVSSFSPPTPRPYSPMVGAIAPQIMLDDGRLGANLSRSRSVVPSASSKFAPSIREPPRSAQAHQTFNITSPPRIGVTRSPGVDESLAVPV